MGIRITIMHEESNKAEPWARRLTKRSLLALLLGLATMLAAAGVAVASIPASSSGTLRGCYSTRTGVLRLLTTAAQSCRAGERAVSWNQGGFRWDGGWRPGASYTAGDAVSYQGSSYIATRASSGKVPSLSIRFWSVLAASGQPGPPGQAGQAGQAGTLASAEFYQAQTGFFSLGAGASMPFSQSGSSSGSAITRVSPTSFQLADAGLYEVAFQLPTEDEAEFELTLNGTALPGTAVGNQGGLGGDSLSGDELIRTSTAGETLSLRNAASFSTGLDFTGPGSDPLTASLVIKLLSTSS